MLLVIDIQSSEPLRWCYHARIYTDQAPRYNAIYAIGGGISPSQERTEVVLSFLSFQNYLEMMRRFCYRGSCVGSAGLRSMVRLFLMIGTAESSTLGRRLLV